MTSASWWVRIRGAAIAALIAIVASALAIPTARGAVSGTCVYDEMGATDTATLVDFVEMNAADTPIADIHRDRIGGVPTFIRSVFAAGTDRFDWGAQGLRLAVDVAGTTPLDYRFRSELRQTAIYEPIPVGTTQAYCMRFSVEDLPDLFGPVSIFQRFSPTNNGPDLEVELTGANQFGDAVPNDLQVVAFGGRHRTGYQLSATNTLLVVIHNHATNGAYKVVLNGEVVRAATGINTVASPEGSWVQFGLYPHGLHDADGDDENRHDQIASGSTRVAFEYDEFELVHYSSGSPDLSGFDVTTGPSVPSCNGVPATINLNRNGGDGVGTSDRDVIIGTPGDDTIVGLGGNDLICGRGGNDMIRGGAGDDTVFGGNGADELWGDRGQDLLLGGSGDDALLGGSGADELRGGPGDDALRGGADDDTLAGHAGDDQMFGGQGDDRLLGGADADSFYGGSGADTCLDAKPGEVTASCT